MIIFKQQGRRWQFQAAACFVVIASALMPASVLSEDIPDKGEYDYLVEVESKPIEGFLKYKESKLGNFYKISVTSTDLKTNEKLKYEDLYVSSKLGDKPALVGLRRYAPLQKEMKKKRVATQIKFSDKSAKEEEIAAASYGFPPVLVDMLLNDNFAGSVYVPTDAFFAYKQALNSQGFQAASQVVSANTFLVSIQMQSLPQGRHESMFYYPSLKK